MSPRRALRPSLHAASSLPLPRGQLEWLKLSFPVVGGVGVGWDGSVVGGVDEEGELPPPQE
jgi:hypothetical protein